MERRFAFHEQKMKRLLSDSGDIMFAVTGLGRLLDALEQRRSDDVDGKETILDDDPGVISYIGLSIKYLSERQRQIFEDMAGAMEELGGKKDRDKKETR